MTDEVTYRPYAFNFWTLNGAPLCFLLSKLHCPSYGHAYSHYALEVHISCFLTVPYGHLFLDRILSESDAFDITLFMRFCSCIGILDDI